MKYERAAEDIVDVNARQVLGHGARLGPSLSSIVANYGGRIVARGMGIGIVFVIIDHLSIQHTRDALHHAQGVFDDARGGSVDVRARFPVVGSVSVT